MTPKGPTDVLAGGFLMAVAVVALVATSDLRMGTAMRMGPGYMPTALGWILLGFGFVLLLRGCLRPGRALAAWAVRPLLLVSVAVGLFGLLLERLGLVAAILALVLIAALGGRDRRPAESLLLALGLAFFAVLLFVKGLGLAMPIWPEGLG
ncbi:MAG: tripartite tricarboxylate transporter TctB family protein [Alphaproteobacteria bacterium]|nr:tripartite tricarboxylate transporter TctB family protein [Alphaproteobacteria bacterium]